MARPLPRFTDQRRADERRLARILAEVGEPEPVRTAGATAGGDEQPGAGVPILGRGVSVAIRGTDPIGETIRRDRQRRFDRRSMADSPPALAARP